LEFLECDVEQNDVSVLSVDRVDQLKGQIPID
jgi:hypothetical protein